MWNCVGIDMKAEIIDGETPGKFIIYIENDEGSYRGKLFIDELRIVGNVLNEKLYIVGK